jgi:hypothetical protein
MKHTLLASTALVALTSAAAAEITISGTARIGLVTTEGAAKVNADSVMAITAPAEKFIEALDGTANYLTRGYVAANTGNTGLAIDATIASGAAVTAQKCLRSRICAQLSQAKYIRLPQPPCGLLL